MTDETKRDQQSPWVGWTMKEGRELYDEEQHQKRQAFEEEQESKRLQFQAEQERKRLEFQATLETRKARRDWLTIVIAFIAVMVSVIAAVFAGLQWKSSKDALQVTQRPWLRVEFVDDGSNPWRFYLRNVGLSVAQDMTLQFDCRVSEGDSPDPDADNEPLAPDIHVLVPGETMFFQCARDKEQQARLSAASVTVTLRAHYKDIFGARHKAAYCVHFEARHPGDDIACREGNFAD